MNPREENALKMYKAKENVTKGFQITVFAAVCGLGIVASYFIVRELFPSALSPNNVFGKSLEAVQKDDKVRQTFGTPIKGFGKDFGGHRAGRRNFVENLSYVDDDGVEHTRILFNIEGSRGRGRVWADKSAAMSDGQFYYLVVQDIRSQDLWAIVDNRPKTPEAVRQEEIATSLSKKGVVLFGGRRCAYTQKQLELFGVNATKQLNFVNCDDDFQKCVDAGIEKLPTWDFNGTKVPGVKSIEDLDVLSRKKFN